MPGAPQGQGGSWTVLEGVPKELVAFLDIKDHVLVCRTHFIVHLPGSVYYLQGASFYQGFCSALVIIILTLIPVAEIFSLIMSESPRRIFPEGINYIFKNFRKMVLHKFRLCPREKIIDSFKERGIVRMRNQVHNQFIKYLLSCYPTEKQRQCL
jgi:hypothetical protein